MKQQSKKLKKEHQPRDQTQNIQHSNIHKSNLDQLPNIQTILSILPEDRQKKIGFYFEQVKPFLTQYIQKKVGSRVSQLIYKWGSNSIKTAIYQDILKHWKQLVKSSYALHIIAKVSRQFEFPGLVEDFTLLQNNKQGAQVLQNYLTHHPETQIAKKIRQKIINLSQKAKEGDLKSQQALDNMAIKSIQKQYYHFIISKLILRLRLSAMFQQEKLKALQKLIQNAPNLVRDEEGIRLFIEVVNNCSSKQKKTLVKLYKGNINQIVNANNISYISVIKLITQIDDTVLISKSLIQQIIQLIPQLLTCKKTFSIIFSLFSPKNNNFNILGKYQHADHVSNCKKPEEQRKKELRQNLYQPLVQFFKNTDNLSNLCKNPIESKLIVGIYKSMEEDHYKDYKSFMCEIAQYFLNVTKEAIKSKDIQKSLIADNNASKIIKGVLNIHDDFIDFYCDQFSKVLSKNAELILKTKASFVLLSIIQKGGRDHLLKELTKSGINFSQCVGGQHYLKLINKK